MEIVLALIEHSSWVIFFAVLMWVYRKDLPSIIKRLQSLKAGSVELKLYNDLHAKGFSKEQLTTFGNLSFEEMDVFLLVSFLGSEIKYKTGIDKDTFKKHMQHLAEIGLLTITNPHDDGGDLQHVLTENGRELRSSLIKSTKNLLELVSTTDSK